MDHDGMIALFDRRMRRDATDDTPGTRIERVGDVVRQTGADWNGVLWSRLDRATADTVIAEQLAYFTALGRDFEWKLYAYDRPDDLGDRLLAAGFTTEPEEALMVAEIAELSKDAGLPDGVRLEEVTDRAGVELMADVHEQAFGTSADEVRGQLLAQLGQEHAVLNLAMAGETPVCAARLVLVPGTEFAGLWGGGTLPAWRGRGIYRALVAHRARLAADRGYRFLQVDASEYSRPILERLGFEKLSATTPYLYEVRADVPEGAGERTS
ncbi:GNAT family N-acetyltransferase [Streptomyces sp. NPDC004726]